MGPGVFMSNNTTTLHMPILSVFSPFAVWALGKKSTDVNISCHEIAWSKPSFLAFLIMLVHKPSPLRERRSHRSERLEIYILGVFSAQQLICWMTFTCALVFPPIKGWELPCCNLWNALNSTSEVHYITATHRFHHFLTWKSASLDLLCSKGISLWAASS